MRRISNLRMFRESVYSWGSMKVGFPTARDGCMVWHGAALQ